MRKSRSHLKVVVAQIVLDFWKVNAGNVFLDAVRFCHTVSPWDNMPKPAWLFPLDLLVSSCLEAVAGCRGMV